VARRRDAYKAGTETPAFTFARLFIRQSFGFGGEQEDVPDDQLTLADKQDISRLGWNDGHNETWTFTDADYSVSLGVSVKGEAWHRHDDTFGLAGIVSGASRSNREFLQAGGTDMLDGDGVLNYGSEKILETYYDFQVCTAVHMALDYQFITNPAFNRDRGPVSVFGARLHWEF
jgi:high affinity Mn2+ porin